MKKIFLLILPLLAVSFNSCSKDDDGGSESNDKKIVSQVSVKNHYGTYVLEFSYDSQNRLTKIYEDAENYTTFDYSGNTVTITDAYGEGHIDVYTATLNSQGYITVLKDEDGNTTSYTYDGNGYLSKTVWGDGSEGELLCTWSNGDLVMEKSTGGDPYIANYEYTSIVNKTNLNVYALTWGYFHVDDPELLGVNGLLGKMNTNLIKKATDYDGTRSFSYTFDSDGYPTTITENDDSNGTSTYTITY